MTDTPLSHLRGPIVSMYEEDGWPAVAISRYMNLPYSAVLIELLVAEVDTGHRNPVSAGYEWVRSMQSFDEDPRTIAERHNMNLLFVRAEFVRAGEEVEWGASRVDYSEEFWDNVRIQPPGECWEWTGKRYLEYGMPETVEESRAHRYSFRKHYGSPTFDCQVLHHCDNQGCTNPDHLFLGTPKDNMDDMARKERVHDKSTERAFTPPQVIYFRRRFCMEEDTTLFDLLEEAPVSAHTTLWDMIKGDTYKEFPVWPPYSDTIPDTRDVERLLEEYNAEQLKIFESTD